MIDGILGKGYSEVHIFQCHVDRNDPAIFKGQSFVTQVPSNSIPNTTLCRFCTTWPYLQHALDKVLLFDRPT